MNTYLFICQNINNRESLTIKIPAHTFLEAIHKFKKLYSEIILQIILLS
jgi:hypothetical protein